MQAPSNSPTLSPEERAWVARHRGTLHKLYARARELYEEEEEKQKAEAEINSEDHPTLLAGEERVVFGTGDDDYNGNYKP